ncbi:unnamed protein product, partial [Polarella glacialis]
MEQLVHRVWLLLLRFGAWLRPVEVQHRWTETSATLLLRPVPPLPLWDWAVEQLLLPPQQASALSEPSLQLLQISDSHVSLSPLVGSLELHHGRRMHQAFAGGAESMHNGSRVYPPAMVRELLDLAVSAAVDVVALSGDILNFPQESAVRWASSLLNSSLRYRGGPHAGSRIPYLYTTGNHDWFFEGTAGSQPQLHRTWRQTGLHPFYATAAGQEGESGNREDYSSYESGGVLVLTLDNSRYQVSHEQLSFFRWQVLRWMPTVLVLHVPLSVSESLRPHRGFVLCGDPSWGLASDRSWRDEGRAPWPASGNLRSTELFLKAVMAAAAPKGPLIAVLVGHTHAPDATPFGEVGSAAPRADEGDDADPPADPEWGATGARGAVQYISAPAFSGGYRLVSILSAGHSRLQWAPDAMASSLNALVSAREMLSGLTWAAVVHRPLPEEVDAQETAWSCWNGASGLDSAAGKLNVQLAVQAIDAMRQRTMEGLRHGLKTLAVMLRPLLEELRSDEGPAGPHGASTAACHNNTNNNTNNNNNNNSNEHRGMLRQLLVAALPVWADPPELAHEPGKRLEVKHGCPMIFHLSYAVAALRSRGDWTRFGVGI